jgi:hypothetical protein
MAAFFLLVLIAASGSYFGLKVARAQRGEPWNASRTFKTNLELIGPHGVAPKGRLGSSPGRKLEASGVRSRPARRTATRHRSARSVETIQFVLALCAAASCFTVLLALFGMIPWEIALGTLAASGLYAAVSLEGAPAQARVVPRRPRADVAYLSGEPVLIDDLDTTYAAGGWG